MIRRSFLAFIVTLLGALAIFGAQWAGRNLDLSPPLLIYGDVREGIMVHDARLQTSLQLFPIVYLELFDSDFYWSPDRRSLLTVQLETSPDTNSVFRFTLYPDWFAEPVSVAGFDRYSTPRWSPDGQAVVVQGCLTPPCTRSYFYRIRRDAPMIETLDFVELSGAVREWEWLDEDTLILWRDRELSTLKLTTGEREIYANDMPPQPRELRWTEDVSRVSYLMSSGNNFCLRVFFLAERDSQEVVCGGINPSNPMGWMDDGQTLFYVYGDADEIRLYDSASRSDRSATNPPTYLDWAFDGLFQLPQTPYLVHHASFGRQMLEVINVETARIEPSAFDLQNGDFEFVPSPDGQQIAMLLRDLNVFSLVRLEQVEPLRWESPVCCTVVWD